MQIRKETDSGPNCFWNLNSFKWNIEKKNRNKKVQWSWNHFIQPAPNSPAQWCLTEGLLSPVIFQSFPGCLLQYQAKLSWAVHAHGAWIASSLGSVSANNYLHHWKNGHIHDTSKHQDTVPETWIDKVLHKYVSQLHHQNQRSPHVIFVP